LAIVTALAAGAASAHGARVSVSGDYSWTGGHGRVAEVNSGGRVRLPLMASCGEFFTADVLWSNRIDASTGTQRLHLALANPIAFSGTRSPLLVNLNIVKDFRVAGEVDSATARTGTGLLAFHTGAGQSATIGHASIHEGTLLPESWVGEGSEGDEDGSPFAGFYASTMLPAPSSVGVSGLYRMNVNYNFLVNAKNGGAIVLPASGGFDEAQLVLVPLPPAAWAGLGCLALVGGGAYLRRRRLQREG
jgi:hypothetical protein